MALRPERTIAEKGDAWAMIRRQAFGSGGATDRRDESEMRREP